MNSRRIKSVAIIFILLILPLVFTHASLAQKPAKGSLQDPEELISGLLDLAADKEISQRIREKLFKTALGFAESYGDIEGENEAFYLSVTDRIRSITLSLEGDISKAPDGLGLYETMLLGQRQSAEVKVRVDEFVMGLLRRALVKDAHSGVTTTDDKGELIKTAFDLARLYSGIWGDGGVYFRRIEHIVTTLPTEDVSTDEEIIREFQEAMRNGNTLAKQYLVGRLGARIKPFTKDLIGYALIPILTATQKEELLTTAMNFAKTYGEMSGDHSFHRRIHRRTFTARLSEPALSEPIDNLHIVDAPRRRRRARNLFIPDNMVIQAGETVRWVNNDDKTHVIGTFDFLSDGHFFEPTLAPNAAFEHTFTEAGEYYYICYIHRSMIGKITVKE